MYKIHIFSKKNKDMDENLEISPKELERRRKISEFRKKYMEKKRMASLRAYWRKKRKEKEKLKREKEREKLRKKKLAEKKKHTRRPGRPKKRGPKKKRKYVSKKPKIDGRKLRPVHPIRWKIVLCVNKKQVSTAGKYRYIEDARAKFAELMENDKNVIFQMETAGCGKSRTVVTEYLLLELGDENKSSVFRNEYGEMVEHKTDKDGWNIIDKFQCRQEEQFWVYGYDNRSDKKDFMWIYENLLTKGVDAFSFNRIYIFKSKLIIKHDDGSFDMVLCKSSYDSSRLYNLLQEYSKKDKIKQLLFVGDKSALPPSDKVRKQVENEMMELTGWSRKKVNMNGNTYFGKNAR